VSGELSDKAKGKPQSAVDFVFSPVAFELPCLMAKPQHIELPDGTDIPILYEDRAVLAIDKPAGWLLVPESWERTGRNLQLALMSSMSAGDFWARSRNLKFLRFIHRLDADTSGILLFAKSPGALSTYSRLFEDREMEKTYWSVVDGVPKQREWICDLPIAPDPKQPGRMIIDPRRGNPAETHFRVLAAKENTTLIEGKPVTGRTHQIRIHLEAAGHPVIGDRIYGRSQGARLVAGPGKPERSRASDPAGTSDRHRAATWDKLRSGLALRAVSLAYSDPFSRRPIRIEAPREGFARQFGFTDLTV
jgi:RluA family pseudouridine synthase